MRFLRPALASDYPAIAALHAANWQQTYRGILSDRYLDEDVEADRLALWKQRLEVPAPNQRLTVATQDGAVVGFCCVFLDDDPTHGSLIDNLHVAPGHRQTGVARQLVRNAAHQVQTEARHPGLYLWVFELNQNAKTAYDHLGGTCVETVEKTNEDGTTARICRYAWPNAAALLA
jgi:ribosomal protein S18 acetylase RimI-like enzyme